MPDSGTPESGLKLDRCCEPAERIALADRYMAAFVREADKFLERGCCVGNFNVGHWGPETVDYFPSTLTAIQAQVLRGEIVSYFCFHEYDWPLLRDDTHWYTGKSYFVGTTGILPMSSS